MRCDDCKFWSKENGKKATNVEVGRCKRAIMWWDATEWVDPPEGSDWDAPDRALLPEYAGVRVFVQDGSDYFACMFTTADFFCADHSPN